MFLLPILTNVEDLSSKTILLVEDDPIMGMLETRHLKRAGFGVIHLLQGQEAIDFVFSEQTKVDIVLMDIDLGRGIDGIETAREILANARIPIVFLSSYGGSEVIERSKSVKSYGYVIKNSSEKELVYIIKFALNEFAAELVSLESGIAKPGA